MIETITACVTEHLRASGADTDVARHACLVDSKGSVETCILLLFEGTHDAPVLIAKGTPLASALRRDGTPVLRIESDTLHTLDDAGMNDDGEAVPLALGAWERDGVLVTLQTALRGRPMKNIPGPELFGPEHIDRTVEHVMAWWRRLHDCVGIERVTLDDDAYASHVLAGVDRFRRRFIIDEAEGAFLDARFRTNQRLAGLDLPLMLRHGDFCTANMVAGADHVAVFDWEFPRRHTLPLFDLFHFFGSLRFPYRGPRGESSHFESFTHVFWGDHHVHRAVRVCLEEACDAYAIPEEALEDLFVLALIEIANLKYDGLVEFYGVDETAHTTDDAIAELWRTHAGPRKDVPFTLIREGVCENTRFVATYGLPVLC